MSNYGNGYKTNGPRPFTHKASKPKRHKAPKSKKTRSPLAKFLIVLSSILGVFVLLTTGVIVVFAFMLNGNQDLTAEQLAERQRLGVTLNVEYLVQNPLDFFEIFQSVPERTNFALLGLDKVVTNGVVSPVRRADAIMVGTFNSVTTELVLISIPRDTRITLSDEMLGDLADVGRTRVPRNMIIGELFAHAGNVHGTLFTVAYLQEMLGIRIHYYMTVEVEAFDHIIDAVGGIYYNVPQRMLHWYPEDGYEIDLHPGYQLLNGRQARGLLQFRGYAAADLRRIQVQQDFAQVALIQLLGRDNIVNNFGAYISIMINHVRTNISITDIMRYFNAVRDIRPENIRTYTMPHEVRGSGLHRDPIGIADLVQDVFFSIRPEPEPENGE